MTDGSCRLTQWVLPVAAPLGKNDVVVYDASMSEWASDSSLPMETG